MNSSKDWLLLLLLVIDFVSSEDPCESAIDISNSRRDPSEANSIEGVELCDSDLEQDKWYFLGGEITDRCVDLNRCSTFAGIWYEGQYPTGDEIVTGRVCAKLDLESCCGWSGTIKIRNCPQGYVYQLATPDDCPMSYCVGKAIPCTLLQVYAKKNGVCYDIPQLQKPTLGDPYISKFQMFGRFNTTKFSVDCNLNSDPIDDLPNNAQLKVETVFRMNDDEVARFVLDYPVSKVTLEESKLVGHIGKTLTCEAHLFYEFKDGSKSTNSNSVKSLGYYFGIEATDCNGVAVKEIIMKQGVSVALHLQSTFPITYGHCVGSNECHILKYSFKTAASKVDKGVRQDKCQIRFENPRGILIYKSLTPINIMAQITPGKEHSKQFLSFEPFRHMGGKTIFEGVDISPVQINVEETEKQPTCHSVGDPHFSSFSGVTFDNYYTGDFNLLTTKHRTFQIQVRQIPCFAGKVTCNCGMIAREGNNLLGISTCDYRKAPVVFQLMKDDVNPTASLKITNNEYHIKFVSGISLKITLFGNPNFLNIYVNAIKHEQYEGICSATAAPADFNVYRVAYAKSFFKSQLPPCVNEMLAFPECKCVNDQLNEVMCEFSQLQQDTGIKAFENICGVKKRMRKVKRSADDHEEVYLVVESNISEDGTTIEDIFSTVDRSRDTEDLQFKELELMTSNEAQGHCSKILEKIQFSKKCREFLGDKHEALQKNCIDDVKLTGRAELAQTYLNIYEEVCMTTLAKEVAIVDGEKSPESKEIIDVLEEMNSTFNERQLNSSDSWKSKSKTGTSIEKSDPCPKETVLDRNTGICTVVPQLQKPTLSNPYISAYKMFGTFNATMFSVDCELSSTSSVMASMEGKLKVETIFKMNEEEIAKFVSDFPVTKVALEETYLVGHIGKTLTCEAQLYYEFNDGSFSTRTSVVKSSGYYFGIEPIDGNGAALKKIHLQQGVSEDICLRSTFPITFGHCVGSNDCNLRKYSFAVTTEKVGLQQKDCQIQFENPHGDLIYKSSSPINIAAQITPGKERSKQFLSFKPLTHQGEKTLFNEYVISPVQVVVSENQTQPTCHSIGDPHFKSFHGKYFDNYFPGDFNLVSTNHRTFQIQVRQIFCAGRVTCNCGMIAREGNNLIGISVCDYRSVPVIFQLMKDNVNPTVSLELIYNEFHIKFASGIIIKVSLYRYGKKPTSYLNIYVNGLKHEQYDGICSATSTPADFNVFRIPYSESFFKGQLPSCVNEVSTFPDCKCVTDQQNVVSAVCGFSESQQDTGTVVFENICDVKKGMKKETGSAEVEEVSLAVESKTSKEGVTLDEIFNTVHRGRDDEDFKEVELMPLKEAQNYCSRALEKSNFYSRCRQLLGDKFKSLQTNCIDDVRLSGTREAADIYLNIYEEVCKTMLATNVTIVDGEKSSESNDITEVLAEMATTFIERQLNSSESWKQESTTDPNGGTYDPCPMETVFDRNTGICSVIPQLQKPILSSPYISAYKMFGTFNATMFSVDCELNSTTSVVASMRGKLKVETVFKMNEEEIAKFVSDFPVIKVTLEETYLVGHMGKTLTCEAQLYYEFKDGSFSTRTSVVKSSGYHFGIEPIDGSGAALKKIHLQQGVPEDIYLRSTFPITFGHCVGSNDCNLRKHSFAVTTEKVGLRQKDCQIQFENPHGDLIYKSSSPINIAAQITPGKEHSKQFLSFKPLTHQGEKTLFKEYVISPVQVVVSENQTQPTCHSIGDPHFKSFHGKYFDNYFPGDFNLVSTKHRTFQIQVRQIFCAGRVTCNCGMIAREGNNLIGISVCDYRSVPVVFQLMKDNVNPTVSLELIYNEFHIKFASGIIIKVSLYRYGKKPTSYLNIYVNGLKHEQYDGICSATSTPADFNVFRIPYSESFFKGQLPSCVNEVSTFPDCKCVTDQQNVVSAVCGFSESQQDTGMVVFENICDVKKGMKKEMGSAEVGEVFLAVESKTSKEGVTLDEIFNTVDRGRDDEDFKEVELMSVSEAQSHCSRMLEKSQFYNKCRELLGDNSKSLQTNCIDDVRFSGTSEAADIYLNIYEEVCMTMLSKEVAIVDGEKSPESKEIIDALAEMNTTFTERLLNSSASWIPDTKPCSVSAIQKFIGKLNSSHVLVFSGTILITGTVVFNILH